MGLYAAFIVGLVTPILGVRPSMISGATGAIAVMIVSLVKNHRIEYLLATVIITEIFQTLLGIFRMGNL